MNIFKVILGGSGWWWVKQSDKTIYPFKHRSGWALINPAFYPAIAEGQSPTKATCFGGPEDAPDTFVVSSNFLCLESPIRFDALPVDFPFTEIPNLLRQLRFVSRYARFPTSFTVLSATEMEAGYFEELPMPAETRSGLISGVHVDALLTEPRVESFTSMDVETIPAIHSELLLDAIEAHRDSDYKKSILFAAMAAETMATSAIEDEHRRIIETSDGTPMHRVVEVQVSGGERRRKDPIFAYLTSSRRSTQIRLVLHETSLYTLGRSLLIENKDLYDEIIELFSVRHEIVHAGGSQVDEDGIWEITAKWRRPFEASKNFSAGLETLDLIPFLTEG